MKQIIDMRTHFAREKFAREWAASHGGDQQLNEGRKLFDLKREMQTVENLKNENQGSCKDNDEDEAGPDYASCSE